MKQLLSRAALVACAVILWITLIDRPQPSDDSLGASWESALGVAHLQHGQFGKEVIFTAGPWGYLASDFITPGVLGEKLAWECFGKFLLALGLVILSGAIRGPARWIFLAALPFVRGWYPDVPLALFILLAVLVWLLPEKGPRAHRVWAVLALAFLAQVKFTYCVLALLGVIVALAVDLGGGRRKRGLATAGGFLLAFVAFWLAAGQNPVRLPDYFRYSLEISRGYPLAMGLEETRAVFFIGLGVVALNFAFLVQLWIRRPATAQSRGGAVFTAGAWFLLWRHGFIRGDDHVHIFFALCLLLALALPGIFSLGRSGWFYLTAPLCLLGAVGADPGLVRGHAAYVLDWRGRLAQAGAMLQPARMRRDFAAAWGQERSLHAMPEIRQAVGTATIDLFNFEQGLLWLNDLQPRLRPIFQSYSAYTAPLMAKNLRFYQSERAPKFILVRLNSIDNRLPTEDDALALAEWPRRYEYVLESEHGLLLRERRTPPRTRDFRRQFVAGSDVALGETILVPSEKTQALWLQAGFRLSGLGRLRSAWYRPPLLGMVITDQDQREKRYRFLPSVAAEGFLLQPLLETTSDYAKFAQGIGWKWARSLRFEAEPGQESLWRTGFVRFSRIPELPVAAADPLAEYLEAGITNLIPSSVHSDVGLSVSGHGPGSEFLVHAPGRIEFTVPVNLRRLRGNFGIKVGAYTGPGRTDGAEFVVQATLASGQVRQLWRRWLQPLDHDADRGRQSFALAIPIGTTQLALLTLPGPRGDSQWDWTFWSALEFSP